ncbi:MAG: xanthine dehydrogenase family protein molybdopterin-binding subunit [Nitrososphaerales archaeon]
MSQQVLASTNTELQEQTPEALLTGRPLKRKEDFRLLTGRSPYVDDLKMPGMLHSAVLRSPYAHANILGINVSKSLKASGVRLVLTAKDIPNGVSSLPVSETDDGVTIPHPLLASGTVNYVGEPVAFIIADTRYQAEDALELIDVDYEALRAVIDPLEASKENSAKVHPSIKSNIVTVSKVNSGNIDEAFEKAAKVISLDLLNQRLAPSPLETRSCLASYNSGNGTLSMWLSTQGPFQAKTDIASILGIPENRVRIIAPEVGGGFGAKISMYSEEILASISSMKLSLPVKWIETRSENLQSMTHGRGQLQHVEIASNEKGRILGMKVKLIGDAGAYLTDGSSDATFTIKMSPGTYIIPAYYGEAQIVLTNKVPHDAYRGASRPEAIYLIERAVDELARELKLDPAEVRLRNFIPRENFPYTTVGDLTYDSGDYAMNLKKALELSSYDHWLDEQKRARSQGRLVGIGISTYVEICAFGPDFPQTAAISVTQSGKVTIISGTSPHGQGHETPLSQIAADKLGIKIEDIYVSYGDTALLPWGTFTAGSRSAALGGSAVLMCAEKIRDKMARIAAKALEVPVEDIAFENGEIFSKTNRQDPKKRFSFHKVASYAYKPKRLPEGIEPTLFAFSAFAPPNYTFPFGTHVAVIEIDKDTGKIKVLSYTSVDDCGKVLNPLIVEGQIHGGIAQGLAQALLEGVKYSDDGQLLTASFLDYQIPMAEDIPELNSFRTETPTTSNPLGIKGVGEAGTIAATPTLANAVADALAPLGKKVLDMPLTPNYIKQLIS